MRVTHRARNPLVAMALSSHPEPVVAVTLLAALLALSAGRGWGTVWVGLAILAGQLFVGWSNDYLDRRLDAGRADKPAALGEIEPRTVAAGAVVALVAAVPLSLASGVAAASVHFIALASATAYNLGLKGTALSPVPYIVSFALVPAFVTLGLPDAHWPAAWAMVAAALIGVGGHFAQSRPDVDRDRQLRILGAPALIGERGSAIAAAVLLVAAAAVVAGGTRNALPLLAFLPAVGVAVAPAKPALLLPLAPAGVAVLGLLLNGSSLR